ENAIYRAHAANADRLAATLRDANWTALDELAALSGLPPEPGAAQREDAGAGDPEAAAIIGRLRAAARRDEHEAALASPLSTASGAALHLIITRNRAAQAAKPAPAVNGQQAAVPVTGQGGPGAGPGERATGPETVPAGTGTATPGLTGAAGAAVAATRLSATDVPALLDEIRAAAAAHPDAEFEISWRVLGR
ncbi:MAG TPA: hypothetical protein VGD91_15465, partial [Trebonia sp.]